MSEPEPEHSVYYTFESFTKWAVIGCVALMGAITVMAIDGLISGWLLGIYLILMSIATYGFGKMWWVLRTVEPEKFDSSPEPSDR